MTMSLFARRVGADNVALFGGPEVEPASGVRGFTLLGCPSSSDSRIGIPTFDSSSDPDDLESLSLPNGFLRL